RLQRTLHILLTNQKVHIVVGIATAAGVDGHASSEREGHASVAQHLAAALHRVEQLLQLRRLRAAHVPPPDTRDWPLTLVAYPRGRPANVSGAELPACQRGAGGEDRPVSGGGKGHLVRAVGDAPPAGGRVERGEQPRVGGDGDPPGLPRSKMDSLEAEQARAGGACRPGQVELRYDGARDPPSVGDREGGAHGVTTGYLKVCITEGGVAQPVPEGVARPQAILGEPPVSD